MADLLFQLVIVFAQMCLLVWIIGFLRQSILVKIYGDAPFLPTPYDALATIAKSLEIEARDVVYELGSGDGRFLIYCARQEPSAQYVGIERNVALVFWARVRTYFSGNPKNVQFLRKNIHEVDLTNATKIYAYLLGPVMDKLLPTFQREFRGRLASRAFVFREKQATSVVTLSEKKGRFGEHLLHVYDF